MSGAEDCLEAEGSRKGSSYEKNLCEDVFKKQKETCCLQAAKQEMAVKGNDVTKIPCKKMWLIDKNSGQEGTFWNAEVMKPDVTSMSSMLGKC